MSHGNYLNNLLLSSLGQSLFLADLPGVKREMEMEKKEGGSEPDNFISFVIEGSWQAGYGGTHLESKHLGGGGRGNRSSRSPSATCDPVSKVKREGGGGLPATGRLSSRYFQLVTK